MNSGCVCEQPSPLSIPEHEVARRWWALPPGCLLPLQDGLCYRLLFVGRPGGASGPDVRDAIFAVEGDDASPASGQRRRLVGDVEFHVRSGDWAAHGHQHDPRYNNVILHVVLFCDDFAIRRQDGQSVPLCSLADLAIWDNPLAGQPVWPCQQLMLRLGDDERTRLLRHAGLLRFEQKTSAFVEQLRATSSTGCSDEFDGYDVCLLPALTEGSGYGRDREFFRAAGLRLLGNSQRLPEPLGHGKQPSPLDAGRLRSLQRLVEQWRPCGAWRTLRPLFSSSDRCTATSLRDLRAPLVDAGLSLARTDILIINVILPFAAAVALLENDEILFMQAEKLYSEHPGLPSNAITRMMCRQLHLARAPRGSCPQQGLHYIYQQYCREKLCEQCIMSKRDI